MNSKQFIVHRLSAGASKNVANKLNCTIDYGQCEEGPTAHSIIHGLLLALLATTNKPINENPRGRCASIQSRRSFDGD